MKTFRTILAITLCLLMMQTLPALAVISQTAAENLHHLPDGFELLKPTEKNIDKHLTAIRIPGFEDSVYAYTEKSGATVFLVYGKLADKNGLYEGTLSAEKEGESLTYRLNVFGEKPFKFNTKDLGRPKAVKLNQATLPEGYRKTSKPGVLYFTNIFEQKEYRVLGRIDGRPDAYYPAANGKPKVGSLLIDMSRDQERFKPEGEEYMKLPKEYKAGYATAVLVLTTQSEWVSVLTDKPILNMKSTE